MNTAQTIIAAGFDLGNLDNPDFNQVTHKVAVIEDADGEPVSGFYIVGKNSAEYQEANNVVRHDNIKRASKRSKHIDSSTDEGAQVVANTVDRNEKAIAIAITVGWFGFNAGGQPREFDKALVAKMFDKFPVWQAKVINDLEKDSNFMKV